MLRPESADRATQDAQGCRAVTCSSGIGLSDISSVWLALPLREGARGRGRGVASTQNCADKMSHDFRRASLALDIAHESFAGTSSRGLRLRAKAAVLTVTRQSLLRFACRPLKDTVCNRFFRSPPRERGETKPSLPCWASRWKKPRGRQRPHPSTSAAACRPA